MPIDEEDSVTASTVENRIRTVCYRGKSPKREKRLKKLDIAETTTGRFLRSSLIVTPENMI